MGVEFWALLVLAGVGTGVCSGLLGIGGGILLVPVLLYLPPLVAGVQLDMAEIAGLTMAQGFMASCAGILGHRKHRRVCWRLVRHMGPSMVVGSAAGAMLSVRVPGRVLLAMFAALALAAALLMCLPRAEMDAETAADTVRYPVPLAIGVPGLLGGLLGMVGQGGAFILIPFMLYGLRLPTRVALGSSLGILLFSTTAGLIGKLVTAQVPLGAAAALLSGSLVGGAAGGWCSGRVPARALRYSLAALIGGTAIRIWAELLLG
ncbi:MAG: sulfite exporter TauE/SafE family protein [Candidatus Methylomirabilales bacterium]